MSGRPASGLALRKSMDGDVCVLEIVGELVIDTARELVETLVGVGTDEDVVLDLARTSFMDSTGLRVVLSSRDRINAGGHMCVLVAVPDGQVEGLLEFIEMRDSLEVEPTREHAITRIRAG